MNPLLDSFVAAMNAYWLRIREEPDDHVGIAATRTAAQAAFDTLYTQTTATLIDYPNNPFRMELLKFKTQGQLPELADVARIRAVFTQQSWNAISPV